MNYLVISKDGIEVGNLERDSIKIKSESKFIAWYGQCSIAVGPTVEETIAKAKRTLSAPNWVTFEGSGPYALRITTYGSQKLVQNVEVTI